MTVTDDRVVSVTDDSALFVLSQGLDEFGQGGREEVNRG